MERNPLRYVWQHSRLIHLGVAVAIIALIPIQWLLLHVPQVLVDDAILGRLFANASRAPFLPLIIELPYPLLDDPWVIFRGLALQRREYFFAGLIVIAGLLLVRLLILWLVAGARNTLARRMARQLRTALFRRLLAAGPSARDDSALAANLSGPGIAAIATFLGEAIIVPGLALGQIVIVVLYSATLGWLFGGLMAVIAIGHALSAAWTINTQEARIEARAARERAISRATVNATGRALAVRIHGPADAEERGFTSTLHQLDAVWRVFTARATRALQIRDLWRDAAPLLVIGFGGYWILTGSLTLGGLVALLLGTFLLPRPIAALVTWRRERQEAQAVFQDIARTSGALVARERRGPAGGAVDMPTTGPLVATDVAAFDPQSGLRIAGVTVSIDLPAHVALVGDASSGADVFAQLIGAGLDPSSGSLTLAGQDLSQISPAVRAKHIAFAGGAPILLPATLRQNLLYGAKGEVQDRALIEAITVAGIDDEVYALGLAGNIDGGADPTVTASVLAARRAVREALTAEGIAALVDPFDPAVYNTHATVAENLMFGVPVGDTFRESNLARHPFVRAVLEAEDLTGFLETKGLAIARSMLEIFEGVPDGHPLFERFSFFSAGERGAYEDLLARHTQSERPRGVVAARDRELLLALAFRYVETRHRLGLLDDTLQKRIVSARSSFRKLLPPSLGPAVEFYDPAQICSAASFADNLLFGRVAHDVAGAEDRVQDLVRRVLADRGLDHLVFEVGLSARLSEREPRMLAGRINGIDLARCLARQPDILVAAHLVEGLGTAEAQTLVERLNRAMKGRSLIVTLPNQQFAGAFSPAIGFERGAVARADATQAQKEESGALSQRI